MTKMDLGKSGSKVGTAVVKDVDLLPGSENAGFYAVAYRWNGQTIISYCGTDEGLGELVLTDLPIVSGDDNEAVICFASQFYQSVLASPGSADIVLTGQSLGGALAGASAHFGEKRSLPPNGAAMRNGCRAFRRRSL
ncbi:hypothetical protein HHL25_05825 [Rhizobium sp. S-51]|uniref:Fungal lipase-like domain-containing protein n=1 Tax=Rhizobium terricola TaxID=2728849 RepID=A0A7Y0AUD8_9HYPH|nr:hypothetical protein [Rhizobium terricola]NML73643.1 hypothetical protein [Rhizobium terricola]